MQASTSMAVQVFADLCPPLGLRVGMAAAQTSVGTEAATLFPDAIRDQQSIRCEPPLVICNLQGPTMPFHLL